MNVLRPLWVRWLLVTVCVCSVQIDDYSMVRFLPFDCSDEEGINMVLQHIDFSIQYGEDLDFKEPKVSLRASQGPGSSAVF